VTFEQQKLNYLAILLKLKQSIPIFLSEGKFKIKLEKSGANSAMTIIDPDGDYLTPVKMAEMSNTVKEYLAAQQR